MATKEGSLGGVSRVFSSNRVHGDTEVPLCAGGYGFMDGYNQPISKCMFEVDVIHAEFHHIESIPSQKRAQGDGLEVG